MSDINAFSKYNNEIKDLKNSFNPSSFLNDLINKVSALSDAQISKLNSLLSKFSINLPFKSSVGDQINNLLNDQINKLKLTTLETISNLSNASLSLAGNIFENFVNDLASYVFIADSVTVKTIEALYNVGGDLSYSNNYIREQALIRDWNYTLEFIDTNTKNIYNAENDKALDDIVKMSKNCCKNNISYVFDIIYSEYESLEQTISSETATLETLDPSTEEYTQLDDYITILQSYLKIYSRVMVMNMKFLIVNSYDYLRLTDFQNIFSKYPKVLKPRYFGDNDDMYGNDYTFSTSDINMMAPFWDNHGSTSFTDETITSANVQTTNSQITSRENNDQIYSDYLNRKKEYNSGLSSSISNGGINSLYDERASYNKNSSGSTNSKFTIQYKNEPIIDIEKNVYIDPKNAYIKQIYVYLTSTDLHGDDAMVHELLYQRLRYPYMTSAKASLDKALSYITTGPLATNILKTVDTIEGSIYNYIKLMDKYFLDPRYHNKALNEDRLDIILPEFEDIESSAGDPPADNINGVNVETIDILETADRDPKNIKIKTELNNMIRFIENISVIDKIEIFKRYILFFYDNCIFKELDEVYVSDKIEEMCLAIFNRTNVRTIQDFNKIFDDITTSYLNTSLITIISILFYNKEISCFKWDVDKDSDVIESFRISILLLSIDIYISGFIRTVYLFDSGQLSSGVKKYFNMFVELCDSINDLENPLYKLFYMFKDTITNIMHGYDEFGILYMDKSFSIYNTNVVVGDYNKIIKTVDGTFFLGTKYSRAGILMLSDNNKLIESNITTGEWKDCFELNTYTFFINENNEIYIWDKNIKSIINTNISESFLESYKLLYTVDNGVNIFAISETDNIGIKRLNMSTFEFEDTNITTGYNWKIYDGVNGIFVFSPDSDGLYLYSSNNDFVKITDPDTGINTFDSIIEFTEVLTTETSTTNPDTGEVIIDITTENIIYSAFGSNNNKGIKLLNDLDKTKLIRSRITTGNISFTTYLGTDYVIDTVKGDVGIVSKTLSGNSITLGPDIINISYFYSKGESLEVLLTGRNGIYIKSVEIISTINTNVLYSLSPFNSPTMKMITGLNSDQLNNIILTDNYEKNHIIAYGDGIEGLYTLHKNETEFKKVVYSKNTEYENSKTWNIKTNDSDTYISNLNYPNETIKVLTVTNSVSQLTDTNLISDKWEIVDFNNKGLALSINGYNKGIMKKDSGTVFSPTSITYNDFKPYYVNNDLKQVFIGTYRVNDTILNMNAIPYNLDEYIFYLNNVEKQDTIIALVRGYIDNIKYNITDPESPFNENVLELSDLLNFTDNMLSSLLTVEQTVSNYSLLGNSNNSLGIVTNSGTIDSTSTALNENSLDFNVDDEEVLKDVINSVLLNSPPSEEITKIILTILGTSQQTEAFDVQIKITDYPNIEDYSEAFYKRVEDLDMCLDNYLNVNPYDSITP